MIPFNKRCIPINCDYCKHLIYIDVKYPDSYANTKGLYTCTHPDSPRFQEILEDEQKLCKYAVPSRPLLVGVVTFSFKTYNNKNKIPAVLRIGNWVTRFISIRHENSIKHYETYSVGTFKTAQEAFINAGIFIDEHKVLFRSDMPNHGKLPTHLVIELQGRGKYPTNVHEQFISPYLHGRAIPYMDRHGIIKPENLLKQRKNLPKKFKIDSFGRLEVDYYK